MVLKEIENKDESLDRLYKILNELSWCITDHNKENLYPEKERYWQTRTYQRNEELNHFYALGEFIKEMEFEISRLKIQHIIDVDIDFDIEAALPDITPITVEVPEPLIEEDWVSVGFQLSQEHSNDVRKCYIFKDGEITAEVVRNFVIIRNKEEKNIYVGYVINRNYLEYIVKKETGIW